MLIRYFGKKLVSKKVPLDSCGKEYSNYYSAGALNHFHQHLKHVCCTRDLKDKMLTYAREKGIMKTLKKKGLNATEIVAA